MHYKNLQTLAIGMFKVHTKTSPEIIQEVFLVKEQKNCNLRNQTDFVIPQVKSVNYGLESIRVLEPKIWEYLPNDLKNKEWKLNHVLAVFIKFIYRTWVTCRDNGKQNEDDSVT